MGFLKNIITDWIDERVEPIATRVEIQGERLSEHDDRFDEFATELESFDWKLAEYDGDFERVKERLVSQAERADSHDEHIAALEAAVDELESASGIDPESVGDIDAFLTALSGLGMQTVGPAGTHETVAEAWDDAEDGDVIRVLGDYDAADAGESFPITLDYREKEVTLEGGHPSRCVIDAGDTDEPVVKIIGAGTSDYRNNPIVANLRLMNGGVGLSVESAPFASFRNLVLHNCGSHGAVIRNGDRGTFGTNWYNCQAWNCGGDGFRAVRSAESHGTTYWGCRATGNRGVGFRLRGTSSQIFGGTTQLNHDYGVEVRNGRAIGITGMYIEGNARGNNFPVELYAHGATGLTIDNCYFHGINPRTTDHDHARVQRGVNVHHTDSMDVSNSVFMRYGDGAVVSFNSADVDWHIDSNTVYDCPFFAQDPWSRGNDRPRSDGIILAADPEGVDPAREGDRLALPTGGIATSVNGDWKTPEVEFPEYGDTDEDDTDDDSKSDDSSDGSTGEDGGGDGDGDGDGIDGFDQ